MYCDSSVAWGTNTDPVVRGKFGGRYDDTYRGLCVVYVTLVTALDTLILFADYHPTVTVAVHAQRPTQRAIC
jgi:hypothetical protein